MGWRVISAARAFVATHGSDTLGDVAKLHFKTTQSVVRRVELYNYAGRYDPVTHEALCSDPTCAAPGVVRR